MSEDLMKSFLFLSWSSNL